MESPQTARLSSTALSDAASRPGPAVRLSTWTYRECTSHTVCVEGFTAPATIDIQAFWLACIKALDEYAMIEDADELQTLIDRHRPQPVVLADVAAVAHAVCRGHLVQARATMGPAVASARLVLAWNLEALYVADQTAHYGWFWHTSE